MDGVGIGDGGPGDAVAAAHAPHLRALARRRAYANLAAHGTFVGMPSDDDMGNSEVGHNVLGSGQVVDQGAKLVAQAIASGAVTRGPVWRELVAQVLASGEPLHFLGLLSDGNVHSHIDHLIALLRAAAAAGVGKARVHALLDGRDVPARSALRYAATLETALAECRAAGMDARVASGGGRMRITMDRYEADWAMVARGWQVHVRGEGRRFASLDQAICTLYDESDAGDQDLDPFVIADAEGPVGPIHDGAAVVLFNFRGDRALEITRAFDDPALDRFDRGPRPRVSFAGMMQYDGDLKLPRRYLVEPPAIEHTLGSLLAAEGVTQLAISETQKFGHVTYFWNGNRSAPFDPALERWIELPSDTRPLQERPWMQATAITDALIAALQPERGPAPRFVRVNFANGDMVGHTGDRDAAIVAVSAVDLCVGRLWRAVVGLGGVLVVTADHGNADEMIDDDGGPRTSHTRNPVPFAIVDPREPDGGPPLEVARDPRLWPRTSGAGDGGAPQPRAQLGQVAGTCLELLGYRVPELLLPSLLAPRR
jgi:2,3-bisphosphoglycerate-independent phosphoglycerate mutase